MTKRIAIIDWDGTIRSDFTIRSWVRYLTDIGVVPNNSVQEIELPFALYKDRSISQDELAERSATIYAKQLYGLPQKKIINHTRDFIQKDRMHLFQSGRELLSYFHKHKIAVTVVSGAPAEVLTAYRDFLPIEATYGLKLEITNGLYTGQIASNPGISRVKEVLVQELTRSPILQVVVAMGNSASDYPLLRVAPINIIVNNRALHTQKHAIHISGDTDLATILLDLDKEGLIDE